MYTVNIVEIETDKIVHQIKCKSFIGANRVENGVLVNIDAVNYYTKIKKITPPNSEYM